MTACQYSLNRVVSKPSKAQQSLAEPGRAQHEVVNMRSVCLIGKQRKNFSRMASSANLENLAPVTLSSSLSLPKNCTKHLASNQKTLLNILMSLIQLRSVNLLCLSLAHTNYIKDLTLSPGVLELLSQLKDLLPKNMSSHLDWTSVLFKQHNRNSMSPQRF